MKTFYLSFVVVCCLGLASPASGAKKRSSTRATQNTSNTVRIVKSKPHIFVSFEREGKIEPLYEGQSNRRVWLRFHNNSRWQVMFCSSLVPRGYGETGVEYELERYKGSGETPDTSSSDFCGSILLGSGKSILFSVPREHLTEGLAIRIPFRYAWETDPDGFESSLEPKHFVYFYSEDVQSK